MADTNLSMYAQMIVKVTGCAPKDAADIEDIMRNDILHSTLDWVSAEQFATVAKQAQAQHLFQQAWETGTDCEGCDYLKCWNERHDEYYSETLCDCEAKEPENCRYVERMLKETPTCS